MCSKFKTFIILLIIVLSLLALLCAFGAFNWKYWGKDKNFRIEGNPKNLNDYYQIVLSQSKKYYPDFGFQYADILFSNKDDIVNRHGNINFSLGANNKNSQGYPFLYSNITIDVSNKIMHIIAGGNNRDQYIYYYGFVSNQSIDTLLNYLFNSEYKDKFISYREINLILFRKEGEIMTRDTGARENRLQLK